nr:GHKL domain-containing protein [Olsenella sp. SW781]
MSSSELYALFGNALDNALAAAGKCVEGGRFVSVTLRQVGQMAVAHVENGYVGEVEFEDGLPQTSEDGGLHGYGMRSIAATVERYDGTLSCAAVDGVFHLDVMIPLG